MDPPQLTGAFVLAPHSLPSLDFFLQHTVTYCTFLGDAACYYFLLLWGSSLHLRYSPARTYYVCELRRRHACCTSVYVNWPNEGRGFLMCKWWLWDIANFHTDAFVLIAFPVERRRFIRERMYSMRGLHRVNQWKTYWHHTWCYKATLVCWMEGLKLMSKYTKRNLNSRSQQSQGQ